MKTYEVTITIKSHISYWIEAEDKGAAEHLAADEYIHDWTNSEIIDSWKVASIKVYKDEGWPFQARTFPMRVFRYYA